MRIAVARLEIPVEHTHGDEPCLERSELPRLVILCERGVRDTDKHGNNAATRRHRTPMPVDHSSSFSCQLFLQPHRLHFDPVHGFHRGLPVSDLQHRPAHRHGADADGSGSRSRSPRPVNPG